MDDTENVVRERIRHVLAIYPRISRSMLQVGIGTSMPPAIWGPVLERMIAEGEITAENASHSTPAGRHQSYAILQLASLRVTVELGDEGTPTTPTVAVA